MTAISDVVDVRDERQRGLDQPRDELRPVARLVEGLVLLVEGLDGLLLAPEDLDDGVAGVHLLDVAVERARPRPLGDELLLRPTGDQDDDEHRHRHRDQRDHGEQRADREHHDQDADDGQDRRDQLGQALLERLADVVDVVGDAAQDVAARLAVEVRQRQAPELLVDALAEPVHGPLGDAGHDVRLGPREHRADDVDEGRQQQDPGQRGEVDALAGDDARHVGEHVGLVGLALGVQRRDGLLDGGAGGDLQADDAGEDQVGRGRQDLGAEDREEHAADGQEDDEQDEGPFGPELAEEPPERA